MERDAAVNHEAALLEFLWSVSASCLRLSGLHSCSARAMLLFTISWSPLAPTPGGPRAPKGRRSVWGANSAPLPTSAAVGNLPTVARPCQGAAQLWPPCSIGLFPATAGRYNSLRVTW